MKWKLKDKDGKYRSKKSFKLDCAKKSEEPWEKKLKVKKVKTS